MCSVTLKKIAQRIEYMDENSVVLSSVYIYIVLFLFAKLVRSSFYLLLLMHIQSHSKKRSIAGTKLIQAMISFKGGDSRVVENFYKRSDTHSKTHTRWSFIHTSRAPSRANFLTRVPLFSLFAIKYHIIVSHKKAWLDFCIFTDFLHLYRTFVFFFNLRYRDNGYILINLRLVVFFFVLFFFTIASLFRACQVESTGFIHISSTIFLLFPIMRMEINNAFFFFRGCRSNTHTFYIYIYVCVYCNGEGGGLWC